MGACCNPFSSQMPNKQKQISNWVVIWSWFSQASLKVVSKLFLYQFWRDKLEHLHQWKYVYYFGNAHGPIWVILKTCFWSCRNQKTSWSKHSCPDRATFWPNWLSTRWPKTIFIPAKQGRLNAKIIHEFPLFGVIHMIMP